MSKDNVVQIVDKAGDSRMWSPEQCGIYSHRLRRERSSRRKSFFCIGKTLERTDCAAGSIVAA